MVLSSTKSARCSGTISLEILGQASARPTSSAIGSSLGLVCSAIMPFRKSSVVCSSALEKMAAKLRQKPLDPPRARRRNSLSDIDT